MTITEITTEYLRRMQHQDGLIIQGCGGNLKVWVDGINNLLTEHGLLLGGTKFTRVFTFQHEGRACLLFPFDENVKLNFGKLALWRLVTYGQFRGTWLSDYVENLWDRSVHEAQSKPDCPQIGQLENIFTLMGIAVQTLRQHGLDEQVRELFQRVTQSGSYEEALNVIGDYVNITSIDEMSEPTIEMQ